MLAQACGNNKFSLFSPQGYPLMIPDIDCFTLRLVAYRHNIQTGGYHLSTVVSTRPTNGLFTLAECLLLVHPFNQLTS